MAQEVDGMKVKITADVRAVIAAMVRFQKIMKENEKVVKNLEKLELTGHKFQNRVVDIHRANLKYKKSLDEIDKGNQNLSSFFANVDEAGKSVVKYSGTWGILQKKVDEWFRRSQELAKKFKLRWIYSLLAVTAAIYGILKASTLMNMWWSEGTQILGYFIDTALLPLAPLIEGLLYVFWTLTDWFAGLPEPVQGVVGAIILFVSAVASIGAIWATIAPVVVPIIEAIIVILTGVSAVTLGWIVAIIAIIAAIWYLYNNWDEVMAAIGKLWDWLKTKWNEIWDAIMNLPIVVKMKKIWDDMWTAIDGVGTSIKNGIKALWDSIPNFITDPLERAYNLVKGIVKKIADAILSVPGVSTALKYILPAMGPIGMGISAGISTMGYAQGTDYVPATGLYKLHAGEQVIPKGESGSGGGTTVNISPSIVINNPNITSNIDIRQLANQLSNYWKDDMTRYARGTI